MPLIRNMWNIDGLIKNDLPSPSPHSKLADNFLDLSRLGEKGSRGQTKHHDNVYMSAWFVCSAILILQCILKPLITEIVNHLNFTVRGKCKYYQLKRFGFPFFVSNLFLNICACED